MKKRGRLVLRNFRARFILRCTPFSVIPITPAISLMDIPSRRLRTKASLCLGGNSVTSRSTTSRRNPASIPPSMS